MQYRLVLRAVLVLASVRRYATQTLILPDSKDFVAANNAIYVLQTTVASRR